MPIEPLPESTSRAISSTLVLSDARSVVKELVDNALDARATTVNVEISPNTLDIIQVRDNGTGIGLQDRQLLCKRGCTSKIRSLDDLNRLGGTFLGFRGEALSSVAELSKAVTVTTRVDGEMVGTMLIFGASGMLSSASASHPVGTTLRVETFLQNVPVRKQTVLKNASRTLQAIKALLMTYAFARPQIRFSLKILKAKSDQYNWTYAPSKKDSFEEIAAKIVGKDVAALCTAQSMTSAEADGETESGWDIEALLISSSIDPLNLRNFNHYISIDGRPVAADRTTIKEIVKKYKLFCQACFSSTGSSFPSRPFISMRIRCPPESYDVNIEPAKDEVLFFRPKTLLKLVEDLFKRVYGSPKDSIANLDNTSSDTERPSILVIEEREPFNVVPEARDLRSATQMTQDDRVESMKIDNVHDLHQPPYNPFTIAAMNAKILPTRMDSHEARMSTDHHADRTSDVNGNHSGQPSRSKSSSHEALNAQLAQLVSPITSPGSPIHYHNAGAPMPRRAKDANSVEVRTPNSWHSDGSNSQSSSQRRISRTWPTPETATRSTKARGVMKTNFCGESDVGPDVQDSSPQQIYVQPSSATLVGGVPSTIHWGPGQKPFRTPFKSPSNPRSLTNDEVRRPNDQSIQHEATSLSRPSRVQDCLSQRHLSLDSKELSVANHAELQEIMDFEHRKKVAVAYQRRLTGKRPPKPIAEVLKSKGMNRSASNNVRMESHDLHLTRVSQGSPDQEDFMVRFSQPHPVSSSQPRLNSTNSSQQAMARGSLHSDAGLFTDDSGIETEVMHDDTKNSPDQADPPPVSSFILSDDPRACLIRSREKSRPTSLYRTKSSKLPLETIPKDASTFTLCSNVVLMKDLVSFKHRVEGLAAEDIYISTGTSEYVDFELLSTTELWENTLRGFIVQKYRCEDGQDINVKANDLEFLHASQIV